MTEEFRVYKETEWQFFYELRLWPFVILLAAIFCFYTALTFFKKTAAFSPSLEVTKDYYYYCDSTWFVPLERPMEGMQKKIYRSD